MRVTSSKYPNLTVDGVVQFVDGEAEVTDKKVLARLRKLDAKYGVEVGEDAEPKKDKADANAKDADSAPDAEADPGSDKPAGNAKRDEWVEYAKARGVAVDDDTKVADIKAAVDKLDGA